MKPFKGIIYHWWKVPFDKEEVSEYYGGVNVGLGYCIAGYKSDPAQLGTFWRTSWVVKQSKNGYIETRNSRYRLVKKAT